MKSFAWMLLAAWAWAETASAQPSAAAPAMPYPQGAAFPLMMYEVQGNEVAGLAACGWNIFQSYKIHGTNGYREYLASLAAHRVAGFAVIPAAEAGAGRQALPEAELQPWLRAIAANGAVGWWDLPEEMRPWVGDELALLRNYTAATRRDDPARRPTYEYIPNNRNAAQIARIVPAVDIIGVSCYCEEMQMPHAWVRYKIEEAGLRGIALAGAVAGADYSRGEKIPVAVIFCARAPKNGRLPAPAQTYHDFWSAVVSGARGIGVYAYHHARTDDPGLAENLSRLNEAAQQISGAEKIGAAILEGAPDAGVSFEIISGPARTVSFRPPSEKIDFQYPALNALARAWNGCVYVIAVNSTEQEVTAKISGLPTGAETAVLPFEGRSVALAGGSLTDSFAPWGVHIYKVAGAARLSAR